MMGKAERRRRCGDGYAEVNVIKIAVINGMRQKIQFIRA